MTVAYARSGLIGTLTPQANTTVEPELAILLPPGFGAITARMVSPAPDLAARLVTYIERLDDWVAQFAGAPLAAIAFACTGSSYLIGAAAERALVDAATARLGVPVVTAGHAVVDALGTLSARRVAFVSPYPRALTEASLAYWAGFGIAAAQVVAASAASPGAHPIYGIGAADVAAAMRTLDAAARFDAVVMLGTGMPTLQMIRDRPRIGTAPVLSCTLATAWRTTLAIRGEAPSAANLRAWTDQPAWAARLQGRDDQAVSGRGATEHSTVIGNPT